MLYGEREKSMEEGHGERFHLDIVEFYLYPERASCTQNVNRLHFHLAWIEIDDSDDDDDEWK
jgi:hypothetical protein